MTRYLIATVDGAGNLVPTLGLAARLAGRGHDVRLLAHPSVHARCGTHGWRPLTYANALGYDSTDEVAPDDDIPLFAERVFFDVGIGVDVLAELSRESADVLVADCLAWAACAAGEVADVRTAALFHTPPSIFRGGPLVDLLAPALPPVDALRSALGASPVGSLAQAQDACDLGLIFMPAEFEDGPALPAQYRYVGPVLDGPALGAVEPTPAVDPERRSVLVSFSTSFQNQVPALQQVIDELGDLPVQVVVTTGHGVDPAQLRPAANTCIARFLAHGDLLPRAAAVVTHCGLGTTLNTLAHGVPMVCAPMGRDQHFNAAMIARLGAGVPVDLEVAGAVRKALEHVLSDPGPRAGAARFGKVIAGYAGADAAVEALEGLANDRAWTPSIR